MKTRRILLVLATMAALLSLALLVGVVSAEPDHPPPPRNHHKGFVRWNPRVLLLEGQPGETVTGEVTFTSAITLTNVTVRANRPLSDALTIDPLEFSQVDAGKDYKLTVEITLPSEPHARHGYGGNITLMSGKRPIPLPLPVTVRVPRPDED